MREVSFLLFLPRKEGIMTCFAQCLSKRRCSFSRTITWTQQSKEALSHRLMRMKVLFSGLSVFTEKMRSPKEVVVARWGAMDAGELQADYDTFDALIKERREVAKQYRCLSDRLADAAKGHLNEEYYRSFCYDL